MGFIYAEPPRAHKSTGSSTYHPLGLPFAETQPEASSTRSHIRGTVSQGPSQNAALTDGPNPMRSVPAVSEDLVSV